MEFDGKVLKLTPKEAADTNLPLEFPLSEAQVKLIELNAMIESTKAEGASLGLDPFHANKDRAAAVMARGLRMSVVANQISHYLEITSGFKALENYLKDK